MKKKDINAGDILLCEDGFAVVARQSKDGLLSGQLICDPKDSCAKIPYCLNGGKRYTKLKDLLTPKKKRETGTKTVAICCSCNKEIDQDKSYLKTTAYDGCSRLELNGTPVSIIKGDFCNFDCFISLIKKVLNLS